MSVIKEILKPYRTRLLFMVITGFLGTLTDIVMPFFPAKAITLCILPGDASALTLLAAVYIVVLLAQTVLNGIAAYLACGVEMYVGRDLKNRVFHHLQELSVSYYNRNSVGYLHARVMSDTDRIGTLLSWNLMSAVWNLPYIFGSMAVMLYLKPELAVLVIAIAPFTAVLAVWFQSRLIRLGRRMREMNAQISSDFNEGITGAVTVKSLGIEDRMDRSFFRDTEEMRRVSVQNGHFRGAFLSIISCSGFLALSLVLWSGGSLTEQGAIELGTLSIFVSYALGMMEPVRWVVRALSDVITARVHIERVTKLLNETPDVQDTAEVKERYGDSFAPKEENWEPVRGEVEFRDVTFRYPDGGVNVLEHFNLKIPKGSMVALVGETGAGKSTLVNLVCRFFEPTEGAVLLDGKDLRERSQHWLHARIGYVLQTPHLFSGTLLDNIRFGRPEASMEQVEEAVRRVGAEELIRRLPDGYETDAGESGARLSAGERQLISFARALVKDPALLILDEATSSVDAVSEQAIQRAMAEVMRGRTSFVIAHRLSTIRKADVILVVSGGKIVEQGTHAELLAKQGAYYRLYERQYESVENKLQIG